MIYRFELKPICGDRLAAEARAEGVPVVGSGPPEMGVSVNETGIEIITGRELTPAEHAALLSVVYNHEV